MSKVAIVGVEGSGKTVLMGALCECYKQGTKDEPYLMPENQAAFMFMERIPHKLRVEREWPEATSVSSLKAMRWTLRLGAEVLEEIEMLDYPGELYRLAFGERTKEEADAHRTELIEFLEHLTSADTLLVLLNLGDVSNLGANSRNAETVWITRGIFDFAKRLTGLKHQALVFTQADRFAATLSASGGPNGVYAKHLPMLKTLFPDLKVTAVSAVSSTEADGRPKQGFSTDGCLVVVREILAEKDREAQRCLNACEKMAEQIKRFTSGSPDELCKLIERFASSVADSEETAKYFRGCYDDDIAAHRGRLEVYEVLSSEIKDFVEANSDSVMARKTSWNWIVDNFDGCEYLLGAFHNYYACKVAEEKRKALEEEKKTQEVAAKVKRESRNATFAIGGVVLLIAVFVLYLTFWVAPTGAYQTAKSNYEARLKTLKYNKTEAPDGRALLDLFGGEAWRQAQADAQEGATLSENVKRGRGYYVRAIANLNSAIQKVETEIAKPAFVRVDCRNGKAKLLDKNAKVVGSCGDLVEVGCYEKKDLYLSIDDSCIEIIQIPGIAPGETRNITKAYDRVPKQFEIEKIDMGRGVELQMIWLMPGRYEMGSSYGETGRRSDEDWHDVLISKGFWIARIETTEAQWDAIMNDNRSGGWDVPKRSVSWEDCQDFINKLNRSRQGADGRFRLPTEAEWEYACRAGTTGAFAGNINEMTWFLPKREKAKDESGSLLLYDKKQRDSAELLEDYETVRRNLKSAPGKANRWAIFDMHGSLLEWCSDWYGNYKANYGQCVVDPTGPATGWKRVLRGGCYSFDPDSCRSAMRYCEDPSESYNNVGFRLVRSN